MEPKKVKVYFCPRCGDAFRYQLHRSWLIKKLSIMFPVKKYFCGGCQKARYVSVKNSG
jgi:hypothetical protein